MIGHGEASQHEIEHLILNEQQVLCELGPGPAKEFHAARLERYFNQLMAEVGAGRRRGAASQGRPASFNPRATS